MEIFIYLLYYDIEPTQKNISFCLDLKKIFIKYYELVIKIFKKNGKCVIKQDIIDFYDRDEFDFLLNIMINNNKNLSSVEKLYFLSHSNKVDINDIFNSFELNDVNKEFISCFKKMDYEFIFKDKIEEYIYKLISKINNISDIGIITELINFRNIKKIQSKHIYFFLDHLIIKYDNIVEKEIKKLINDEKLNITIKNISNIAIIYFIYEKKEKKLDFIKNKIKKFSKELYYKILIEIINIIILKEEKIDKYKDK